MVTAPLFSPHFLAESRVTEPQRLEHIPATMTQILDLVSVTALISLALSSSCRREDGSKSTHSSVSDSSSAVHSGSRNVEGIENQKGSGSANIRLEKNVVEAAIVEAGDLRKKSEAFRIKLFSVPLSPSADKDRSEAWKRLEIPDSDLRWKPDQFLFAEELLKRYESGTQIEKLVFWQLVCSRRFSYRSGGIERNLGDQRPSLLNEQLDRILYSALGVNPTDLPQDQAFADGLRIIDQAAAKK